MSKLSVIIPTFNNEDIIKDCLESIKWADEIIVVDSFSTDKTLGICRQYTDKVYQHEYVNSAAQKNWALDNIPISSDWVFLIDSDEKVAPELKDEILKTVNQPKVDFAGYYVNRKTFAFGKWIRHCGWYPNYNIRLFKKDLGRFEDKEVHAEVKLKGLAGHLKHDFIHFSYRTISGAISNLNQHTTWEAMELMKREKVVVAWRVFPRRRFWKSVLKRIYRLLPGKSLMYFVWAYFIKQGFRDGMEGFIVCVVGAFYVFVSRAKFKELRKLKRAEGK